MQAHRALILRGNRFLGSTLVDKKLVSVAQLEEANERFMELLQGGESNACSVLNLLVHELKLLDEQKLMEHYVEQEKIGLIDLDFYRVAAARDLGYDPTLAAATKTIPFDRIEGFTCLATCYYLSTPVVKHWSELLGNKVIWYGISLRSFSNYLGRVNELEETLRAEEEEAAEQAAEEAAALEKKRAASVPKPTADDTPQI